MTDTTKHPPEPSRGPDSRPNEPRASDKHIVLSTHPRKGVVSAPEIHWGAATAKARGPVIGSQGNPQQRNVIGVHSGA